MIKIKYFIFILLNLILLQGFTQSETGERFFFDNNKVSIVMPVTPDTISVLDINRVKFYCRYDTILYTFTIYRSRYFDSTYVKRQWEYFTDSYLYRNFYRYEIFEDNKYTELYSIDKSRSFIEFLRMYKKKDEIYVIGLSVNYRYYKRNKRKLMDIKEKYFESFRFETNKK